MSSDNLSAADSVHKWKFNMGWKRKFQKRALPEEVCTQFALLGGGGISCATGTLIRRSLVQNLLYTSCLCSTKNQKYVRVCLCDSVDKMREHGCCQLGVRSPCGSLPSSLNCKTGQTIKQTNYSTITVTAV